MATILAGCHNDSNARPASYSSMPPRPPASSATYTDHGSSRIVSAALRAVRTLSAGRCFATLQLPPERIGDATGKYSSTSRSPRSAFQQHELSTSSIDPKGFAVANRYRICLPRYAGTRLSLILESRSCAADTSLGEVSDGRVIVYPCRRAGQGSQGWICQALLVLGWPTQAGRQYGDRGGRVYQQKPIAPLRRLLS